MAPDENGLPLAKKKLIANLILTALLGCVIYNGINSALPYLAMWLFSMLASILADAAISSKRFSITQTRKTINSIGQYGPAICLVLAAYTGCNPFLTVLLLTIGLGLNGAIYSGFKVNHLDISPRFAGILMSFTNCLANFSGLIAPNVAGVLINKRPTQAAWRIVFFVAAAIYILGATFYLLFASGVREEWDDRRTQRRKSSSKDTTSEKKGSIATTGFESANVFGIINTSFDDKKV